MKRLVGLIVAAIALGVLVTSHGTSSAGDKQLICHVAGKSDAHIIEVSVKAVPAHLKNHGDCLINSTNGDLVGESCDPTDANDNDICDVQP